MSQKSKPRYRVRHSLNITELRYVRTLKGADSAAKEILVTSRWPGAEEQPPEVFIDDRGENADQAWMPIRRHWYETLESEDQSNREYHIFKVEDL